MLSVLAGLCLASPAHAGWGSLIKGAAKLGKLAGKSGKLAKGAKGVSALEGGTALKGASVLGAHAAADGVFAHMGKAGSRAGLFVADDGAGALTVVTRQGDELSHSAESLAKYVDDLDQMAEIAPDAGVDLFVDAGALQHLSDLPVGPNTRLWLADPDGMSLPMRTTAEGMAEVGIAAPQTVVTNTASFHSVRLWVRVGTNAGQLAVKLADIEDEADTVVIADADCSEVPDGAVLDPSLRAIGTATGTVVVVTDDAVLEGAELRALSDLHGVDLVVLGLDEVCAPGEAPGPPAAEVLTRVQAATTFGELWAAAGTNTTPAEVADVVLRADHAVLTGPMIAAVHRVVEPVAADLEDDDDEPPPWFYALVGLGAVGFLGWKLRHLVPSNDE